MAGSLDQQLEVLGATIRPVHENVTPNTAPLDKQERIRKRLQELYEWGQKLWEWARHKVFDENLEPDPKLS